MGACVLAEVLEWEVDVDLVAKVNKERLGALSLEVLVHSRLVTPG